MSSISVPPLPGSEEPQHHEGGGVLGMLAAACGGASLIGVTASVFLLTQEEAMMSAAALVMGGLAVFGGLIALILGFVAFITIKNLSRTPAIVGVVSGIVTMIVIVVVSVLGMFHAAERRFQITDDGIETRLPPVDPLVVGKEAWTENDVNQLWHRWFEENMYQVMKPRLAGKPWEKDGLLVIEAFEDGWLEKRDQLRNFEWQILAANLVRKKCDDPMLLYMTSRSCDIGPNKFGVLTKASKGIGILDLNPLWAFMAEVDKAQLVEYAKTDEERKPTDAEVLRRLKRACEAGSFDGEYQWLLNRLLRRGQGYKFVQRHGARVAKVFEKTEMPEWTVHWMRGVKHDHVAWEHRKKKGSDGKRTEAGLTAFREEMERARKELTRSWELAPEYPFASGAMVNVSMGSASENAFKEMRLWLDRSMEVQIDNWVAFNAYRHGLKPAWHGDREMMKELAERCLESGRYDSGLPMMYLEGVKDLAGYSSNKIGYYRNEEVYRNLSEMVEGYLAVAEDLPEKRVFWTYQAIFSYRAEDYEKLGEVWELLEGAPNELVWSQWKVNREDLVFHAGVDQENVAINNGAEFREQGLYDDAIKEYEAVIQQGGLDEKALDLLRRRIALLRLEKQWQAGEWVTLWPTKDVDLWFAAEGRRVPDESGSLRVQSDTFRYAIEHPLILGRDFEIESSIGPALAIDGNTGHGIWMGKTTWDGRNWDFLKLRPIAGNKYSVEAGRWRYREDWKTKIARKDPHLVHLKSQDKIWTVTVDGKKLNDKGIERGWFQYQEDTRMALGGYVRPDRKTTVNYQSVRVRKLESKK